MNCFISSSYNTDITEIKKLLIENNINYLNINETFNIGTNISENIINKIKDCDFIIAVVNDSPWIAFEIGMAVGNRKPVFLIIPETNKKFRSMNFLHNFTYTFANPNDYNKIKYNFEIFLDKLPKKRRFSNKYENKKIKGKRISNDFILSLGDFDKLKGNEFENMINKIFKELKLEIISQNSSKVDHFKGDFSLWVDELNAIIGNPIIVEVKSTDKLPIIKDAIIRLSKYLSLYNSSAGLLIYNNPQKKIYKNLFSVSPLVLSISIQDFLKNLLNKSLPEIITELRNAAVHKEIY